MSDESEAIARLPFVRDMLTEAESDALSRKAKETLAWARGVYPNLRSR